MAFAAKGRALRLAGALVAVLAIAACAKNPAEDGGLAGAGGYAAPGSPQDFVVNVGDRVFFESDSVELTPTAQATLDKQARWLQQYNRYSFTIEGRAEATKNYLAARGISPARMHTVSYGKERPVAVCNDISCWSQNRRAVTVLSGGQS
jgi:peptidoglycan-associated lipoprotein